MSNERADGLLRLLRAGEGGFVSGERLGAALGISRAALSKRIKGLKARGFEVQAVRGRGYRLASEPGFTAEELRTAVRGSLGREAVFCDQVVSTNEVAMRMAREGAAHGTVVAADSQTGGRGRMGRAWASPPGCNIYMSVILKPGIPQKDAPLLTLVTAAACALSVRRLYGLGARIKWPNDIVIGGRKLGGVLLEMRAEPDSISHAVAGLGVNLNMDVSTLPREVRPIATSVLEETGEEHPRVELMAAVLDEMSALLEGLINEGPGPLIETCRGLSSTIGQPVRVVAGNDTFNGTAIDIDPSGALLVRTHDGGIREVHSGDVHSLRPSVSNV